MSEQTLEDLETDLREATIAQHSKEVQLIDDLQTCLLRGFARVGSFTCTQENRLQYAMLLLATRSFNSLRCAYLLLQLGYYTGAMTLIRSAMEDNLTAQDCQNEATLAALLEGKGELGKGDLRYTEMAKRQGQGFAEAWQYNYGALSEYAAHARRKSLRLLVDPETRSLRVVGQYDRTLFIGACDALFGALVWTSDLIAKVLTADAEPWQRETFPKLEAAQKWREEIKAKFEAGEDV